MYKFLKAFTTLICEGMRIVSVVNYFKRIVLAEHIKVECVKLSLNCVIDL